jgi:predicted RNA-binding Zn-ribbon protein involved in translation (DUF1610 family)
MQGYPQQAIDYFVEIAIGAQFGQTLTIHKWTQDVLIQVIGQATGEDKDVLDRVATELSGLVQAQGIRIDFVGSSPTTKLYFASPARFARIEPHYVPPNTAFFWSQWDATSIYASTILIASEGITQHKRDHHIVAMLAKNLGLMKKSSAEPTSIFFNGENESTELAGIDRLVVQMLYNPAIENGMTADDVRAVLPVDSSAGQEFLRGTAGQSPGAPFYCPQCGTMLKRTDQYCYVCGAPVEGTA